MVTRRVTRNANILKALHRASAATQNAMLSVIKKDVVLAIVDCAKIIIYCKVPLTQNQLQKVLSLTQDIKRFVSLKTSHNICKRTLQKGGFLGALIGPVLSLIPQLLGGLLPGRR